MAGKKNTEKEEVLETKAETEQLKEHPAQLQTSSQLIYCGPPLPNGLLSRFVVFRDGLPKHLAEHFQKCPALEKCFVPVQSLAATLKAQANKGSAEHSLYEAVKNYFSRGEQ
jgi:hypothetical protein